jgi:hypothetical protein
MEEFVVSMLFTGGWFVGGMVVGSFFVLLTVAVVPPVVSVLSRA